MPWQRLQTDLRFALITLFGGVTAISLLPIATYRFVTGAFWTGLIDLSVVASIAAAVAYMWRGGSPERAGLVAVATCGVGCVMVAHLAGLTGLLWVYPAIAANFLLVRPRHAIAASIVTVGAASLGVTGITDPYIRVAFAVTAAVISLFAYIFARRTESQHEQLERLVTRDTLTAASNRRAMEQELPIAIATSRRSHAPVSLAVLDIDHFKRINDGHGHETGDRVLVDFARIIAVSTRRGDRLFRYGGEEFVLLLPGIDTAALATTCEALRARIADTLEVGGRAVTVSIGAAELAPEESATEWLARADSAMYRAKRDGRNRVVVAASQVEATVVDLLQRQAVRHD